MSIIQSITYIKFDVTGVRVLIAWVRVHHANHKFTETHTKIFNKDNVTPTVYVKFISKTFRELLFFIYRCTRNQTNKKTDKLNML